MERTVFFSKVSLDSKEVYEIIDNHEALYKVTDDILSMLKHEYTFVDEYSYIKEDGNEGEGKIKYVLSIKEKDDVSIYGVLDRNAVIFVKERDDESGEMKSRPVENTEDIEFYYDVLHECIAFISRRRFGKNMFNEAFGKLLNSCSKENKYDYSFYVESYNAGMSIDEMKTLIKNDENIKELAITYRPANPDQCIIDKVREASDKERLKESNATERSIIYKAKGKNMINGGADIIQDDLSKLVEMNVERRFLGLSCDELNSDDRVA